MAARIGAGTPGTVGGETAVCGPGGGGAAGDGATGGGTTAGGGTAGVADYLRLDPLRTRIDTHHRYSARPDDVDAAVRSVLGRVGGERLLDVGAGTGAFLASLAAAGHHGPRVALDTSPAALAACATLPGVRAVAGDAVRLPFADGSFDLVTARHMLST